MRHSGFANFRGSTHRSSHIWHADSHVLYRLESRLARRPSGIHRTIKRVESDIHGLKIFDLSLHLPRCVFNSDPGNHHFIPTRPDHLEPEIISSSQLPQRGKNRFQIREGRMRADPPEHHLAVRVRARARPKNLGVYYRGDDARWHALAGNVLGDRAIAASHDSGPADQIVGLAEPFQSLAQAAIGRASI